jgi:hypothetical protein
VDVEEKGRESRADGRKGDEPQPLYWPYYRQTDIVVNDINGYGIDSSDTTLGLKAGGPSATKHDKVVEEGTLSLGKKYVEAARDFWKYCNTQNLQ